MRQCTAALVNFAPQRAPIAIAATPASAAAPSPSRTAALVVAFGDVLLAFDADSSALLEASTLDIEDATADRLAARFSVVVTAGAEVAGTSMPFPSEANPKTGLKLVCPLS